MSRSTHPISATTTPDAFHLAWLRRTDALADPVIRARSLCGEIARETRADRVSFLTTRGSKPRLIATSLTTTIDIRSVEADRLRQIADEVCQSGTEFTAARASADIGNDPEEASETFAMPVETDAHGDPIDAVIVIQRYASEPPSMMERLAPIRLEIDAAAKSVVTALRSQALKSERRGAAWWRRARNWQRLALVTALCVGLVALLSVPVTLNLHVEGRLEPVQAFGVFAPASGTLLRLEVADDESVVTGQVLAELSNLEIELQQERLTGELAAAETELASLRLRQSNSAVAESVNPSRIVHSQEVSSSRARQMVLRSRIASLQQQNDLIHDVAQSLSIRAPIDGQVVLRDEQADLVGQIISQSQWLMQVVDHRDGYQAIVELPESDDAYLRRAFQSGETRVTGSLRLLATPDVRFSGRITHIADSVHLNERGRPAIEVTMPIHDPLPDDVHVGATVVGTIDVGSRSLAFVWFRPLIEFLRSYGW